MTPRDQYDSDTGEFLKRTGLAAWQKLVAVLSLIMGGAGLALGGASATPDPVDSEQVSTAAVSPTGGSSPETGTEMSALLAPDGLAPLGDGSPGAGGQALLAEVEAGAPAEEPSIWAPLLAKGGFSFFIAFCIGYALRAALKVTMIGVGLIALATFGLQKAGIVGEIDWGRAQGFWADLTSNLGVQFESLKTFVAGSLPTATSGGIGLLTGFRR